MFGPRHGGHGRGPGPRADAEVQLSGHHRQGRAHLRVPAAARLPAQPGRLRLLPGHDQLVSRPRLAAPALAAASGPRGRGETPEPRGWAGRAGSEGHPLSGAGKAWGETLRAWEKFGG